MKSTDPVTCYYPSAALAQTKVSVCGMNVTPDEKRSARVTTDFARVSCEACKDVIRTIAAAPLALTLWRNI